jgi:hypothetical protein
MSSMKSVFAFLFLSTITVTANCQSDKTPLTAFEGFYTAELGFGKAFIQITATANGIQLKQMWDNREIDFVRKSDLEFEANGGKFPLKFRKENGGIISQVTAFNTDVWTRSEYDAAAAAPPPPGQIADSSFRYLPSKPQYPRKDGPVVHVDEAHNNFHTLGTRYYTFGEVLKNDGYRVAPGKTKFTPGALKDVKMLVIANPSVENDNWQLPTPSAFTVEEAAELKKWVQQGGSLFLIVDHMPVPGAAVNIGNAFSVNLYNGYALYMKDGHETYTRAGGQIQDSPITNGRNAAERVDSITAFGGHAFLPAREVIPAIKFNSDHKVYFPKVAGEFHEDTPYIGAAGLFHTVCFKEGKGRVVIAAEAAMFSAQLTGRNREKFGMNEPAAKRNPQFLLNIIHWLDGKLD